MTKLQRRVLVSINKNVNFENIFYNVFNDAKLTQFDLG